MEHKALRVFLRKPVNSDMVQFLVNTTNSVIPIKTINNYEYEQQNKTTNIPSLFKFIEKLIKYSNVQTPTLMSTIIYLNRLRENLPENSSGMETTRHRIFIGCLILASKNLNDSSPLNKHWCNYTDGLINLKDINLLEVELLNFIGYNNLIIKNKDLINNLNFFIEPIKNKMIEKEIEREQQLQIIKEQREREREISISYSNMSIPSLVSSTSTSTIDSITSDSSIRLKNLEIVNNNINYTYSKQKSDLKLRDYYNNNNNNNKNYNHKNQNDYNIINNKENIIIY